MKRKISIIAIIAVLCMVLGLYVWMMPKEAADSFSPAAKEPEAAAAAEGDEELWEEGKIVFHRGSPSAVLILADGAMMIADGDNRVIWRMDDEGGVELYAGRMTVQDLAGRYAGGYNDGEPLESAFKSPWGMVPYEEGVYAISDAENNVIRMLTKDQVFTGVGSGTAGLVNGYSVDASFDYPTGLALDEAGNLYISDTGNHVIRRMDKNGNVETFAGSVAGYGDGSLEEAAFYEPMGLCWSDGALYVADSGNHCIRKIEAGRVSTVAGRVDFNTAEETASGSFADGTSAEAAFATPQGLLVDSGDIYVADTGNGALRLIRDGMVSTLLKADIGTTDLCLVAPRGLTLWEGTLYLTDTFSGIIIEVGLDELEGFGS